MKKIISLLLSFVMIFTLVTPALAASNASRLASTEQTTITLSDENRMEITSPLSDSARAISNNNTSESNNNHTFLIKEFKGDELIHTVQGAHGGSQLICIDYENGVIVNRKVINVADRVTVNSRGSARVASSGGYGNVLGHIVYNKDIGNTIPGEVLTIYSKITLQDDQSYTINGAMADTISDITGLLLSIFSALAPAKKIISKIAIAIVSYYGGNILGDKIGVCFTEDVSVYATYYTLTGYHAASNYYTAGYDGVKRYVHTKESTAFQDWIYTGFTPNTWKDGDDLANILWMAVFARPFPYVYQYR